MKKLISSILLMVFTFSVNAQLKTPKPSPAAKIEQQIGLTDVSINYSRPGVKGRTIFGDLVPYGKLWRTGANENTVITFSDDVVIDGKTLKEGSYAIYTKPNASSWELIFYTDIKNWGTPKEWDDSKVALSTTVSVEKMPVSIETFTFLIDNVTANDAILGMLWENSYVGVKVTVPTDKIVEKNIKEAMAQESPSAADYYGAAAYYLQADKDINKAKVWIDKAIEMTNDKPKFWYLRRQALIHKKAGDTKGAIKAAKASLKHAEKAGNAGYVKQNKASLKEWGA